MATKDRRGVSVNATDTAIAGDPNPGLAIKTAVLVATTANITLAGAQAIDGVSVGSNAERVLVKNQTDATQNGIYNASSGNWTRATDVNANDKIANGGLVFVLFGTVNISRLFQISAADPIILGTSLLTFNQVSFPALGSLSTTAPLLGGGLLNAGLTLSLAANGITYALLQQVAASSLVGNATGSLANATGITLGATLAFSGSALQTAALTGDVTAAVNSFVTTVAKIAGTVVSGTTGSGNVVFATAPAIVGGGHTALTALGIRSTGAAFDLTIATSEVLTAARTLSVVLGDVARTLTFTANATIGGTHSGTSSGTNTGDQTITLTGDVTGTGTGSFAATIAANAVTYAKLQQVAASSLVGNATGSLANATGITLGATLAFSGSALQTAALTGDVTTSANSFATTIAANAVTLAKMATVATATFLGRTTAGTGNVEALTVTQATALLNVMVGDSGSGGTKGLVPAPAAGDAAALKYLAADGSYSVPAGSGGAAASQADMEAASSTSVYVSPGRTKYHPGVSKAWVSFDGVADTVRASYNVSSITDNGSGDYTVNFTTSFSSGNYGATAVAGRGGAGTGARMALQAPWSAAPTASAFRLVIADSTFVAIDAEYVFASFDGDQ